MDLAFFIATLIKMGLFFTIVLTFVAYAVYAERRFSAIIQDRVGPNRTMIPTSILGFKNDIKLPLGGLTQPIADGLKFILKGGLHSGSRSQTLLLVSAMHDDGALAHYGCGDSFRQPHRL